MTTMQPVDLTNLHDMTDGDVELEKELFKEFYRSSEETIGVLEKNCTDGENETWRASAHALKGSVYNLGAAALGELCKKAQESHTASKDEKKKLLDAIKQEYAQVELYLQSIYS